MGEFRAEIGQVQRFRWRRDASASSREKVAPGFQTVVMKNTV